MNNDFDYIKNLFDKDGVRAPDSLSEDNIRDMLEMAAEKPDVTTNYNDVIAEYKNAIAENEVVTTDFNNAIAENEVMTTDFNNAIVENEDTTADYKNTIEEIKIAAEDNIDENAGNDSRNDKYPISPVSESGDSKPEPVPAEKRSFKSLKSLRNHKPLRNLAAVAACLIIAILIVPFASGRIGENSTNIGNGGTGEPTVSEAAAGELTVFKNYGEIEKLVKSLRKESGLGWSNSKDMVIEEMATLDSAQSAEAPAAGADTGMARAETASDGTGHSETYLQVAGVDEADIVKTDGKYIYYVNQNAEVIILSADNGQTQKLATIGNGDVENYIHDIYLKDNKLITIGTVYEGDESCSSAVTYDISDPSAPVVLNTFKQTGDIVSSRMNGNYVYLVTCEYMYKDDRVVPMAGSGDAYAELNPGDICCVPEPTSLSYVTLSAVDVNSGDSNSDRKDLKNESGDKDAEQSGSRTIAVFGASNTIYCNQENLYTTITEYSSDYSSTGTRIIRAGLDGLKIKFEATGKVSGYVYGQFGMDEKDGYFRIATTDTRDGITVNNLYVLDQGLKETGKVTGFARNESIQAVRYIGDKAYVITFEQVDPLFVIDLKDPAEPVIEGSVEIEGFSSLLVPTAENRLLGIGYMTADNGYGGVYTDGLKLALFDISDPAVPKVLDSREFQGMNSPAQYTHLALTVNQDKGYYVIPYGKYPQETTDSSDSVNENETAAYTGGVLVFGAADQIDVYDEHPLTQEELLRNVYIGDWIYALNRKGTAYSFQFPAGE